MNYELWSLFSKTTYTNILEDITDEQLREIKNHLDNIKYYKNDTGNNYTSASQHNFVFKDKELFFIKERIMKEFIFFKNSILKYKNNDFIFTTSWVAKSKKNEISEYHNHNNCMYSGIFYVNTDENCGQLAFENLNNKRFNLIPTEFNIHNSQKFNFKPKNKMIIFFPSELYHKIEKNNSNITRYSIAFNMMPIGNIGSINSDSFLKIDIKND